MSDEQEKEALPAEATEVVTDASSVADVCDDVIAAAAETIFEKGDRYAAPTPRRLPTQPSSSTTGETGPSGASSSQSSRNTRPGAVHVDGPEEGAPSMTTLRRQIGDGTDLFDPNPALDLEANRSLGAPPPQGGDYSQQPGSYLIRGYIHGHDRDTATLPWNEVVSGISSPGDASVLPQVPFVAHDSFLVEVEEETEEDGELLDVAHVQRRSSSAPSVYEGVSMSHPPTAGGEEADTAMPSTPHRRWILPLLIAAILSAAVAATLLIRQMIGEESGSQTGPSRREAVVLALEAALGENYSRVWNEGGSSQARALEWLVEGNSRVVDAQDEGSLVQRYVLAVFYFAMGGEGWTEQLGFLSDKHECSWNKRDANPRKNVFFPNSFSLPNFLGVECLRDNSTVNAIRINKNNLKGSLPEELGTLATLEHLILGENSISDSIPSAIENLSSLRALDLRHNELEGPIPTHLGRLVNLTDLWLDRNKLDGIIPPEIGELVHLESLSLRRNGLNGTIPLVLRNLSSLINLDLEHNRLSGTIPPEIIFMSRLERLLLATNVLKGAIPRGFGKLVHLEILSLGRNQLSGTIPTEIGNMSSLKEIYLENNRLSGTISSTIFKAEGIEKIRFYKNQLTGTIPSEVGNLRNLEALQLAVNRLNGTIPWEMGQLSKLRMITLFLNRLSGTLPPEMGNMTSLEQLTLDGNMFSGTVPFSFSNLKSLRWFTVSNTSLTGNLNVFCDISILLLSGDCYGDSPEVTCPCCNVCCSDLVQGPVDIWEQFVQTLYSKVEPPPEAEHWNCFWGNQ